MPHFAAPTPVLDRRRLAAQPQPTLAPRWKHSAPQARCEDCLTTTLTTTHYVDEWGQSTTCTTTQFQTTYLTNTVAPLPTPTTATAHYETVYHTQTSTLASGPVPTSLPGQAASSPSGWTTSPTEAEECDCERDWVKVFLGGVPHGAAQVMACLAFFFPFVLFFLVSLARLKTYAGDKETFFFLVPLILFLATMLSAMATRAYSASNESTPHFLAQHVMLSVAPSVLMEVGLQLYGLLSKRIVPGGWIEASSLFLRLLNVVAVILYAVAAGAFVSFVNGWEMGHSDCSLYSINRILILNIVADVIEIVILFAGCILLFLARWKYRMETGVLVIQYLLYSAFLGHFFWRIVHDVNASNGWKKREDVTCAPLGALPLGAGSSYSPFQAHVPINWSNLHSSANTGMNGSAAFWLLGILPLFIAATLLMAANLPRYVQAVPPPVPEADSVRYKLCYNEDTKKMEFQRLDNPGGPLLPSGEQLYELVRDHDGDGWAVREARIPTVLPAWHNVTFSPWYR